MENKAQGNEILRQRSQNDSVAEQRGELSIIPPASICLFYPWKYLAGVLPLAGQLIHVAVQKGPPVNKASSPSYWLLSPFREGATARHGRKGVLT